jgi:hypothetical protein
MLVTLVLAGAAVGQDSGNALLQNNPLAPLADQRPAGPAQSPTRQNSELAQALAARRFTVREDDDPLTVLLKQRLQSAGTEVAGRAMQLRAGRCDMDSLAGALDRLIDSYVAFQETPSQQNEMFTVILNHVKQLETLQQGRFEQGAGRFQDLCQARYLRLNPVRTLRIARCNEAMKLAEWSLRQYRQGIATSSPLLSAADKLLNSTLELVSDQQTRNMIIDEFVQLAQAIEKQTQSMVDHGTGTTCDLALAKYIRLNAEILRLQSGNEDRF